MHAFPAPWLTLSGEAVASLVAELAALGIAGGSTYDGLIAATARTAGATLHTCDRRGRLIYDRLGVDVRFVG
jgi:predicted nucleic acid-binding protein